MTDLPDELPDELSDGVPAGSPDDVYGEPPGTQPGPPASLPPKTPPRRSASSLRSEFDAAPSPHDWLRTEVARFLYPDLSLDDAFAGALAHLSTATADLDTLSRAQFEPGDLVGFELVLGSGPDLRRAMFKTLPTPAALLLLCCDLAKSGEDVRVRHFIAHKEVVEMRSVWPFSMEVAVSLVSPSPTELAHTQPPKRRWFPRR